MIRWYKPFARAIRLAGLGLSLMAAASVSIAAQPTAAASTGNEPIVVAASDLKFALEDVYADFKKETGQSLKLVFGSSGNFYRQIQQGAPFQMFLSADESYVLKLADEGKTVDRGVLYAQGRLVLITPKPSAVLPVLSLDRFQEQVQAGRIKRFAIANPAHAPYGARAQEALQHMGAWNAIEPALVYGDNISQTAQFALSGSTDGGIIALSLALAPELSQRAQYVLIPEPWHTPLLQRMVLLKGAQPATQAFYRFMLSPAAQIKLSRYGFSKPKD